MSRKTADNDWQRVREIFDAALRQKPEERQSFVRQECEKNDLLFAEVQSLLDSLDDAEDFMETPAVVQVAGEMFPKNERFASGRILGHYEILEQIGSGGMGEVYLARDLKLNRRVALKVLRENQFEDKQAHRRLLREAQAAARLEHPNICPIYEVAETAESSFIVMQYVTGKTLAERLAKEHLSIADALDLAIQIADALAEAHARGVIHRDIKPANIIVGEKGAAKILDFGLAKIVAAERRDAQTARQLNSSGAVFGTVPFMSPEQLRCKRLDARTDVFSFGALFYEMLAGKPAFARENDAETITAILNEEPDWVRIPPEFQPVLRAALMKNKAARYESARELAAALRELQKSGGADESRQTVAVPTTPNEQVVTNKPSSSKKRQFYFWQSTGGESRAAPETEEIDETQNSEIKPPKRFNSLIAPFMLAIFLLGGASVLYFRQFKQADEAGDFGALRPVRLTSWKSGANGLDSAYRISNSGKMIAFSSTQNGANEQIYVKQISGGEDVLVTKDNWKNYSPLWSPDDQRLAFVSVREKQHGIYVCPSLGGAARLLKLTEWTDVSLRHWAKDGNSIFYETKGNLFRLDLATLETARVTDFAESTAERDFGLSPDERQIVFRDDRDGQSDIWAMPVAGGAPARLTNDADKEIHPLWHADGKRILYNVSRHGDLQINFISAGAEAPAQITRGDGDYELLDVSPDGAKIFYTSWEKRSDISRVNVETGEETEFAAGIEAEMWASPAPDGKSIVYQTNASPRLTTNLHESSLVVKSLENGSPTLVLKGYNPRWLPDSRRIAFLRWHDREQKYQYWLANAADGAEKQITTAGIAPPTTGLMPISRSDAQNNWSPDARRFVYLDFKKQNILSASPDASETLNLTENANPNLRFFPPQFSPDGKRVVYLSTEKPDQQKWSVWLNEQGKSKEIFSTAASLHLLGWSASGEEILLATTEGVMKAAPQDVQIVEIALNGSSRILTTFKNTYAKSIALSADRKTAAFVARLNDKDDVWIFTFGAKARKLTANVNTRLFYANPAFSPDGKTIFFDKQEQINSISVFENFK